MIRFCKKCGSLYDDKVGGCPKCREIEILKEDADGHAVNHEMTEEEIRRARRSSWIQLVIGIPLFIGAIYIIVYLFNVLKG